MAAKGEWRTYMTDGIKAYYNSIKNIPVLTKEEERLLLYRYKKKNDIIAKQKLINSNLKYALKFAMDYNINNTDTNLDDAVQDANLGLIKAIEEYDMSNDNRIICFANWKMLDSIQQGKATKIETVSDDYLFNNKTISENYDDVDDDNYDDVNELDDYLIDDDDCFNFDDIPSEIRNKNLVDTLMGVLTEREYDMISLYYGLHGKQKCTLDEVGEKYNLTKERVRQIIEKSKRKMRIKALVENKIYCE